jgi:energy-coupling factor transport system substrate-specific component
MINYGVVVYGFAAGALVLLVLWYEFRRRAVREIALIVSLAAVAAVSRVPFASLPSVQPTTFIVLISGFVFGPFVGCAVGTLAAFVSNCLLLQGPWTPWQMLAWGLAGFSGGVVGRYFPFLPKITMTLLGFLWGFFFGWMMNFWYWMTFAFPLNWQTWFSVNLASFWFDAAHAVTNAVLIFFFGNSFRRILDRYRLKWSNCDRAGHSE